MGFYERYRRVNDILERVIVGFACLMVAVIVIVLGAAGIWWSLRRPARKLQRRIRGGRHAILDAQLAQRLAEDAVVPGVQKGAAGRHHLFAVAGSFGAHALHRQKMPVALFGAVKAVSFFAFQDAVPG